MGSDRKKEITDSLKDRVKNLDIKRELRVGSLLLCIKRSHLRWISHLIGMPFLWRFSRHVQVVGDPRADPELAQRDVWNALLNLLPTVEQKEMECNKSIVTLSTFAVMEI